MEDLENIIKTALQDAYKRGQVSVIHKVIDKCDSVEECEEIALKFVDENLAVVRGLLSEDYRLGYAEGVRHFLIDRNNV